MTRDETLQILLMLRSVWSAEVVDDLKIDTWHAALGDLPLDAMKSATVAWIRDDHEFMPKPGQLRKIVLAQNSPPAVDPGVAWEIVQREVGRVGFNRTPVFRNGQFEEAPKPTFTDPVIAAAVQSVGWRRICTEDRTKGDFVRRDFDQALRQAAEQQRHHQQVSDTLALHD